MKSADIREGDIVEIDYITECTKEHRNEGKALVIWKGSNHQPLVRKLNTRTTTWACYEHIARVIDHIDIEKYMDEELTKAEEARTVMKRVIEIPKYVYEEIRDKYNHRCEPTVIDDVIVKSASLNEVLDEITKKIQAKIVVRPFFDHGDRNRDSNDALLDAIDIIKKYKESEGKE